MADIESRIPFIVGLRDSGLLNFFMTNFPPPYLTTLPKEARDLYANLFTFSAYVLLF